MHQVPLLHILLYAYKLFSVAGKNYHFFLFLSILDCDAFTAHIVQWLWLLVPIWARCCIFKSIIQRVLVMNSKFHLSGIMLTNEVFSSSSITWWATNSWGYRSCHCSGLQFRLSTYCIYWKMGEYRMISLQMTIGQNLYSNYTEKFMYLDQEENLMATTHVARASKTIELLSTRSWPCLAAGIGVS